MTTVVGYCPACGGSSLFLGDGGYDTCSRSDCPNPAAASDILDDRETQHIVGHSQALSDVESRVRREVAEEIAQAITDIDPRAVAHADGGWWQGFADGQAIAVRRARRIGGLDG